MEVEITAKSVAKHNINIIYTQKWGVFFNEKS